MRKLCTYSFIVALAAVGACREPMVVDDVATDARPDARRDASDVAVDVISSDASDVVADAMPDVVVDAGCSPNLQTDPHHCGRCDFDCTTLPGVASTIQCVAGACDLAAGCAAGRAHCSTTPSDGCEADVTAPTQCGACGVACSEPTPMCTAGAGGVRACASGCSGSTATRCDMMCIDARTDPMHCGDCTTQCTPPPNATPTCVGGMCQFRCVAGYALRNNVCEPAFTIGATVSGLAGATMTVQNNGAGDITVTSDGPFTFRGTVFDGAPYDIRISSPATGRVCTVAMGMGVVSGANVVATITCRIAAVVINEVHARPATLALGDANGDSIRDSSADEFVEVMNTEGVPVDIGNWVIRAGTTTQTVRHTFAAGTVLPAGGRAVVFGGGTPTGGFGGANVQVATGGLSLSDAPAVGVVSLETAAAGGTIADSFGYDASTFGSSCTTACASQTRSPEGTGPFVAHTMISGLGIRWSPGVAAIDAVPKVERGFSSPLANATNVSVLSPVLVQFNMLMNATDLTNANLHLYASTCASMSSEVTSFASIGPGSDATSARFVANNPFAYATTYCVGVGAGIHSSQGTPLDAPASWEFTTRAAASAPSSTVVISEYGGRSFSGNDEFVELFNPTPGAVDVSGWSIQRRSAGGTASCWATLPAGAIIPPNHFYLVGGASYTPASYGGVTADFMSGGTSIGGNNESLVLVAAPASCTGSTGGVDSVSVGAITDTNAALQLPGAPTPIPLAGSVERKACFDSTGDAAATTGMLMGGGHEAQGNSERIGASNADWIVRTTAQPQNLASPVEVRTCP